MDDAERVSIEALERLRDEIKDSNKARKIKREKVARDQGAALLEDVSRFLARFVVYPSSHAQIAHVLWIACSTSNWSLSSGASSGNRHR